ncbi:MAG: YicC family protein [Bacteroidales bacterium]|nr:YicC family protein [Bacteroidales bacterium]
MKSMTGYAKVQSAFGEKKLNIEIKTLNSKQLDLIVKVPSLYRSRELEIRSMLSQLERGKVEFIMSEENAGSEATLNEALLSSRYTALQQVATRLGADTEHLLASLVGSSDIWNSSDEQELDDAAWQQIAADIQRAIEETDRFRSEEGAVLEGDFRTHVDLIEEMLGRIPAYEAERIDTAKERIRRYMAEASVKEVDANRFEQELIYYLEKLDITEEKVRLQKHIDYFRQTVREESSCGKKLGFIVQEMGREINTTGSKANHVEIQKLVVVMKDELEKIKEQLGNIL